VVGRAALAEYIATTHDAMPDSRSSSAPCPRSSGRGCAWLGRRQRQVDVYTGTTSSSFAEDGRIARVTMFYDSTQEGDEAS